MDVMRLPIRSMGLPTGRMGSSQSGREVPVPARTTGVSAPDRFVRFAGGDGGDWGGVTSEKMCDELNRTLELSDEVWQTRIQRLQSVYLCAQRLLLALKAKGIISDDQVLHKDDISYVSEPAVREQLRAVLENLKQPEQVEKISTREHWDDFVSLYHCLQAFNEPESE